MNKYILLSNADYLETRQCYDKVKEYIKPNSRVACIPFACDLEYLFKTKLIYNIMVNFIINIRNTLENMGLKILM